MSLADRYYMRDAYHAPRMTTGLIIILIVAFLVQSLLLFYGDFELSQHLALSVDGLRHGRIWQLLTFQFLHSTPWPWHVLFNCLGLYFFGRPVEEMVGGKKFLALYLLAGVAGGLFQVLVTVVLPRHMDIPVVGASAGVCGMIAIFCAINPMQELTTWIYLLPITIRARYFLLALGAYSIFGTLIPLSSVAHAAHLGGILLGLGYVRFARRFSEDLPSWFPWRLRERGAVYRRESRAKHSRWNRPRPDPQHAPGFISREVDPILDKISSQGLDSLTEKERKILEAARNRLGSGKSE
jgi:membrane associated rhomboid family serine protease